MAEENVNVTAPISSSRLAAENARRKKQGLPPLTLEEYTAQVSGGAAPATQLGQQPTQAEAQAPPPPAAPAAAAPAAGAPAGPISSSRLASENARRKKQGLPPLSMEEYAAQVGGVPAASAQAAPAAAAAQPPASKPAAPAQPAAPPAAAAPPPAAVPAAREGVATRYVGTPAVGTSRAAAAGGVAATGPLNTEVDRQRRRFVWSGITGFLAVWLIAFFRFFLPRTIFEPSPRFTIGYPSDYVLGVDTKWQQQFRIWVKKAPDRLFVIYARCTHLGCTPDWKPSENKFKCPCHGSGYDSDGINFEGPAPRPMDRAHVELDPEGQILVDVSKLYSWPKGQRSEFNDEGAYLPL